MKFSFLDSKAIRRVDQSADGFTLVELLVAVLIISILSSVALASLDYFGRRERVNNVALAMYSWLNEVRQASLRLDGSGCTLSIASGAHDNGSIIIQSAPSACRALLQDKDFVFESYYAQSKALSVNTSASSISFTPRTLTTNTSDLVIGLVVGGVAPQRCLKIQKISGLIEIGKNSTSASPANPCSYSLDKTL